MLSHFSQTRDKTSCMRCSVILQYIQLAKEEGLTDEGVIRASEVGLQMFALSNAWCISFPSTIMRCQDS